MSSVSIFSQKNRSLLPWIVSALLAVVLVKCSIHRFVDSQAAAQASPAIKSPPYVVMAQLKDANGKRITVEHAGASYNVYAPLPVTDSRFQAATIALSRPPVHRLLLLLEAVKRFRVGRPPSGVEAKSWEKAISSPFFLSVEGSYEEHGGFGFVLRRDGVDEVQSLTPFVELTGTQQEIQGEGYERGLIHETGHAIIDVALGQWTVPAFLNLRACGRTPSAFHDVQRTTQPLQALMEGFAEHLEVLAFLQKPGVEAYRPWMEPAQALMAARGFVSPRPRRLDVIIWNRAIFEPSLLSEEAIARDGLDESHRQYQSRQPFDNHRLRSCREMLSTEGVVASLLVRLMLNRELQQTPLPEEMIARFIPTDAQQRAAWLETLGVEGRVQLRLLWAMSQAPAPSSIADLGEQGIREIIQTWINTIPQDASTLANVLITTTLGATMDAQQAQQIRELLATPAVVPVLDPKRKALADAEAAINGLANSSQQIENLFSACGGPLWVMVKGRKLCSDFSDFCLPMELDLNAASEMELRLIPGVTASLARLAVAERNRRGFFQDREAFLNFLNLSPEAAQGIPAQAIPLSSER